MIAPTCPYCTLTEQCGPCASFVGPNPPPLATDRCQSPNGDCACAWH